jgi:hypothetical protein
MYDRIRAMMNYSAIDGEFRDGLLADYPSKATYWDLKINKDKKNSPIKLMFKTKGKRLRNLKKIW